MQVTAWSMHVTVSTALSLYLFASTFIRTHKRWTLGSGNMHMITLPDILHGGPFFEPSHCLCPRVPTVSGRFSLLHSLSTPIRSRDDNTHVEAERVFYLTIRVLLF